LTGIAVSLLRVLGARLRGYFRGSRLGGGRLQARGDRVLQRARLYRRLRSSVRRRGCGKIVYGAGPWGRSPPRSEPP